MNEPIYEQMPERASSCDSLSVEEIMEMIDETVVIPYRLTEEEKTGDEETDKALEQIMMAADQLPEPIKCEKNGDKGFLIREFFERGVYASGYVESQNKFVKICTYLKKWRPRIVFLEGTDPEYIDQILDYTEHAEHDDAPDSAACVCRILEKGYR